MQLGEILMHHYKLVLLDKLSWENININLNKEKISRVLVNLISNSRMNVLNKVRIIENIQRLHLFP